MFTSESVDRFVFDSFLHSQGDTFVQSLILKWAEINCDVIYSDSIERMTKLSVRLMQYANSSNHNSPENMTVESTIGEIEEPPEGKDILILPQFLIYTDLRSTLHKRRPNRSLYQGRESPSHVVLFGLIGATTGHSIYDKMYARLYQDRTFIDIMSSDDASTLEKLISVHLENNPNDSNKITI